MKKLLMLTAAVAMLAGCAVPPQTPASPGNAAAASSGAAGAESLGYHGPVHRLPREYGN